MNNAIISSNIMQPSIPMSCNLILIKMWKNHTCTFVFSTMYESTISQYEQSSLFGLRRRGFLLRQNLKGLFKLFSPLFWGLRRFWWVIVRSQGPKRDHPAPPPPKKNTCGSAPSRVLLFFLSKKSQ